MPEYLAPGVYVEERSFRSKSIEGVGTSTTGFIGPTRYGPLDGEPELMTSFSQFERIYGGLDPLNYGGTEVVNYLAHGVRAFFDNGGARLYIARAFTEPDAGISFVARASIPAPVPAIATASEAAVSSTNTVLQALGLAATALQNVQAGSRAVLEFAANLVLAALTATPPPNLNYNYGAGDDIGTQLTTFVTAMPLGVERDAVNTALGTFQAAIDGADDQLQSATTSLTNVANAMTTVSAARSAGITQGEASNIAGQLLDIAGLVAATTAANNAATTTNTTAAALEVLQTTANTALANMNDVPTAATAVTELGNLADAAADVVRAAVDAPNDADATITAVARLAAVQMRITDADATAHWVARFPGAAGNMRIDVTSRLAANVLSESGGVPAVRQVRDGDLVVIRRGPAAFIYTVSRSGGTSSFGAADGSTLPLASLNPATDEVLPLTLTVELLMAGKFAQPQLWDGLSLSASPSRIADSVTQIFAASISNRMQELETPVILETDAGLNLARLAGNLIDLADWIANLGPVLSERTLVQTRSYNLTGGSDGLEPEPDAYEGAGDDTTLVKSGLKSLEDLEEISIIAAPGYSNNWAGRRDDILAISQNLITHCEKMRYRVAVLDSPDGQSLSGVRQYRALLDTTRAAIYYPWVRVMDPVTRSAINLPPSGFMTGIYARNDVENGVHKAPANEVVRGAIGLEMLVNKAQQDVLNPLGINCIRFFEGRGIRVWGARTISSDPEWKYLNIRRYFAFLEASIDRSTQWAVFEPNGETLWANIRRTVSDFLYNEWKEDHLAGKKPEKAFFVQCDRSTMTQNDLDNGRLICLIGVAPLYPAEFVIFRIGQWTADAS
jgi:uncharacterized protein